MNLLVQEYRELLNNLGSKTPLIKLSENQINDAKILIYLVFNFLIDKTHK